MEGTQDGESVIPGFQFTADSRPLYDCCSKLIWHCPQILVPSFDSFPHFIINLSLPPTSLPFLSLPRLLWRCSIVTKKEPKADLPTFLWFASVPFCGSQFKTIQSMLLLIGIIIIDWFDVNYFASSNKTRQQITVKFREWLQTGV